MVHVQDDSLEVWDIFKLVSAHLLHIGIKNRINCSGRIVVGQLDQVVDISAIPDVGVKKFFPVVDFSLVNGDCLELAVGLVYCSKSHFLVVNCRREVLVVASAERVQNKLLHLISLLMRKYRFLSLIHLPLIPMIQNRYVPSIFNFFRNPPAFIGFSQTLYQYPNLLSRLLRPYLFNELSHIVFTRGIKKPESACQVGILVQKVVPIHAVSVDDDVRATVEGVDFYHLDGRDPVRH